MQLRSPRRFLPAPQVPTLEPLGIDVLSQMLRCAAVPATRSASPRLLANPNPKTMLFGRYEPQQRATARALLRHPYFASVRNDAQPMG